MPAATLSPETIEVVKSTVPILRKHGTDIVSQFYENLFQAYPSVKKQFNVDRLSGGSLKDDGVPRQVSSLARTVMSYAENIDRVEELLSVVERIAHKHVSRGVSAAQYDAVGECLIKAMKDILGDALTEEIASAWTEAYEFLASVFIDTENRIKAELEEKAGYSGFVPMVVEDIEEDEYAGRRLSLKPEGFAVPQHRIGQFVGILIEKEESEPTMTSMSTIREEEVDALWIHVPSTEERASRYLLEDVKVGSVLKVSMPCGKAKTCS